MKTNSENERVAAGASLAAMDAEMDEIDQFLRQRKGTVLERCELLKRRQDLYEASRLEVAIPTSEIAGLLQGRDLAQLNVSQRALLAARWLLQQEERRRALMLEFRQSFNPGMPAPCVICRKYLSVSHAHHLYPLSAQIRDQRRAPLHDYVWLCPTHHSGVHRMLSGLDKNEQVDIAGFGPEEKDAMDKITVRYVEMKYGYTH